MNSQGHRVVRMLSLSVAVLLLGTGQARAEAQASVSGLGPPRDPASLNPMRKTTTAQRVEAAQRAAERRKAAEAAGLLEPKKKMKHREAAPAQGPAPKKRPAEPRSHAPAPEARPAGGGGTSLNGAAHALLELALAQVGTADLYAVPNFATSKYPIAHCAGPGAVTTELCEKDADCTGYQPPFLIGPDLYAGGATCTGPVVPGTGIKKFVDSLAPLCPLGTNNLGNCIPIAQPDRATFPGSDYYEIGLKDYTTRFHSDLPAGARVRGYFQKNTTDPDASQNHYLGPLIVATTNVPVRVKFVNEVATSAAGGNLFVPMDATLAGTGNGPDGLPYSQNRATIHLHGGNTPWISDGTQHQWTVPRGEPTTHRKGMSVAYVPDMWFDSTTGAAIPACSGLTTCLAPNATNDPGDGALTFYYTNQQSGRLMFYHDHAYGITRLNVYAGEAAGYLLVNPVEETALRAANVPGTLVAPADLAHLVPLVIQDKTFVPPAYQLSQQDPTWDPGRWSGEDGLWMPHVYVPNQWPGNPDQSNTNPMGRWDYGPWFWPVQTSLVEVATDGSVINRPLTVPCTSQAAVTVDNPNGDTDCPSTPSPSLVPEAFLDTPVVNGTAYPTLTVDPVSYRLQVLNAAGERNFNLSLFVADASGTEVALVPAVPHTASTAMPLCSTTAPLSAVTGTPNGPDLATPTCWPQEWPVDGRQGGVPDPAMVGPLWLQLGTEGGLLPTPAIVPPRPTVYEQNKRNIVVLNVASKSLFMGPAERADVVVDFRAYAGKTLIVYNDAPAPVPAGDPRGDFYSGAPDFTTAGGAPTPLPGYGPNTRTVMQIKVRASVASPPPPVNLTALTTAMQASFRDNQPKPLVPESAYTPVYNPPVPYADTYPQIQTMSLNFTPIGETTPLTLNFSNKALHELFTTSYGRMDSLLGVEIPNTTWLNQTTIPFSNFDPPTEYLLDNRPQIWKVTHNGVDTHTIHFHLFSVQVVNRVGWDGQVRPPDANELGWKEAVRMNPLEDVILALRPVKQNLPWPLPDMWRPLDVDRPVGAAAGAQFTGVDVYNRPMPVANQVTNFGQEYVWHCHLLGHEEEDMLRAEILVVAPEVPAGLTVTQRMGGAQLDWTDPSRSALGFTVQRDTTPAFTTTPAVTFAVGMPATQPGPVSYLDTTAMVGPYYYRVRAEKVLWSTAERTTTMASDPGTPYSAPSAWSATVQLGSAPLASVSPTFLAFGTQAVATPSLAQDVTLSNGGTADLNIAGISVTGASAADFTLTTTCGATLAPGPGCTISVTFTPAAAGPRTATLAIASDDPYSPTLGVPLTGTGTGPAAALSPASLTFAAQGLNSSSAAQLVTLANNGTAALTITGATVGGVNAADFGFATTCGATLAPAATCTWGVTFTPTAAGARAGSLNIITDDPINPTVAVALTGTGIPAATSVTLTPNRPSPLTNGLAVKFTAKGFGPAGIPASAWQYRFSVNGAEVQAWSATATWTLPSGTVTGSYTVTVEVRTSTGAPTPYPTAATPYSVSIPTATGVTLTSNLANPQVLGTAVTFTAIGQGSFGYQYRFWLSNNNGASWAVIRDWSATGTWTMPASTLLGTYVVLADVRSSLTTPIRDAYTFLIFSIVSVINRPATGVSITPDVASPQQAGAPVTFTAAGFGSTGYRYRFWLSSNNGATWAVVQDWSSTATWTLQGTAPAGTYVVLADVNTNPGVTTRDAYTAVTYQVATTVNPKATGLILTPTPTGPQRTGSPVDFLAEGQGSTGYEYRFWLSNNNGVSWATVRDWSPTATWTLPGSTPPGTYVILADVRTNLGAAIRDLYAATSYVITP